MATRFAERNHRGIASDVSDERCLEVKRFAIAPGRRRTPTWPTAQWMDNASHFCHIGAYCIASGVQGHPAPVSGFVVFALSFYPLAGY